MTVRRRPRLFALALRIYVGAIIGSVAIGVAMAAYALVVDLSGEFGSGQTSITRAMSGLFIGSGIASILAEGSKAGAIGMLVAFALNRDERGPLITALVGQAMSLLTLILTPLVSLFHSDSADTMFVLLTLQAMSIAGGIMVLTGMLTASNRVAHHAGAYETAELALRVRIMWTMIFAASVAILGFSFLVPAAAMTLVLVFFFAAVVGVMTLVVYLRVAKAVANDSNYHPGDLEPEAPVWTNIADDLSDLMD